MTNRQTFPVTLALSALLSVFTIVESRAADPQQPSWIPSLAEPDQGLAIGAVSRQTGLATFASSPGRGILLAVPANATAEERALRFVDSYGKAFGLTSSAQVRTVRAAATDELGLEHVRLQQVQQGVPVTGGEFVVHMKGSRVLAANGHTLSDLPADVTPRYPAAAALSLARRMMNKYRPDAAAGASYSEPRLEILNRAMVSGLGNDGSHLAWFIEVTGDELRQFIWIDAQNGIPILNFSQLAHAKSRTVYNANHNNTLPGTLMRSEGQAATGDNDADKAYDYAGVTYDYYLTYHGRDSYDAAGAQLKSSVHYCVPPNNCPAYANAFWNGTQMVYGDTYSAADDVVGHELTHAVTERTAGLFYYMQSGALNESFSDIFGETIDLLDGVGNDTAGVRWQLGEDLPIGAIRNMMNPNLFSNPSKMTDSANFVCSTMGWTDPDSDHGGVHTNSGVPNHAYALMVDGGTFNGRTIAGIGLVKAAKVQYRALTVYLTSGSGFLDDYNALNRSCNELIGTVGITSGDCTQVKTALEAVEMNLPWGCLGSVNPPAKCTAPGTVPFTIASEGFETSLGNWVSISSGLGSWQRINDLVKTGHYAAYGDDPDSYGNSYLQMINPVVIPLGGMMYFDHLYEFENDVSGLVYDGGIVEYSANGGPWVDARPLIDAGANYDGTLVGTNNPLGARLAFTGASYGFTGTRMNLTPLVGQSVKFQFHIGTDTAVSSLGWLIDNVSIYKCASSSFTDDPLVVGGTPIKAVHFQELRNRINAQRQLRNLPLFLFADPSLTGVTIKATHLAQLQQALTGIYFALNLPTPVFTSSTTVRALNIQELRAALLAVEYP